MFRKKFPHFAQLDAMDCGPACLRIIAKHYGRSFSPNLLRELSETTREGSSLGNISDAAEKLGLRALGAKINFEQLKKEAPLPCIAFWNKKHFVVIYAIKKEKVYISDPAYGLVSFTKEEFLRHWGDPEGNHMEGIVLLLEPTPSFSKFQYEEKKSSKGFSFLTGYVLKHKPFLLQLILGLLAGSLLQLIFPFLTQSIVDIGIQNQDIDFVYLILFAQLLLFLGKIGVEAIRGWILLHLSTRVNISLISDFFIKLMHLPISFFDTKMTGDLLQRIIDHERIQSFLTSYSLSVLFSLVNLVVFSIILLYYNIQIFLVFVAGSILYIAWVALFLRQRKILDYKKFQQFSDENGKIMEIINGMQEIKLHGAERQKRWDWEYLQARLFRTEIRTLNLEQKQVIGAFFINELKNILITILAAKLVIGGILTLGMMLAISYIVGQLNAPLVQLIEFLHAAQDAQTSLERLQEIHSKEEEDAQLKEQIQRISTHKKIILEDVYFRYVGTREPVLKNINLEIPPQKTTAIVGASGSGKTTLMKLLLKFYEPSEGKINIGNFNLINISQKIWRKHCGVVMQEGYIFDDTIVANIALGDSVPSQERLLYASKIANIDNFIQKLPLSYSTKIGANGISISTGQKQRILIARAVYKDPDILFFDEATSALDAVNEKEVMINLNKFLKDKTAIVIAHRLSTVKNAHKIIVLKDGMIAEQGTHQSLISQKGAYYYLVKNQLELERLNGSTK